MLRPHFLALAAAFFSNFAIAAPEAAEPLAPYTPEADLKGSWDAKIDPALPNVLILGDSISISYTRPVRRMLAGKANVVRPMRRDGRGPDNCGDTNIGLTNIDRWLGEMEWDVIHFNWGLWDLCYRHPDSAAQGKRDKVNGTLSVSPEDYAKNLEALVARLKRTGARLIWAHTTLVPEDEVGRFVGDDIKYNAIAARVMARHGIVINDLHGLSAGFAAELFVGPGDVHFTGAGAEKLAAQVAKVVSEALVE
jgi:hypothetical protein